MSKKSKKSCKCQTCGGDGAVYIGCCQTEMHCPECYGKPYYVAGKRASFVVQTVSEASARRVGEAEFGLGNVETVYPATSNEANAYMEAWGIEIMLDDGL